MRVLIGIDVGKTNIRVGVFLPDLSLLERWAISSAAVPAALRQLRQHLQDLAKRFTLQAVGVSIFGPLQTGVSAADYGAVVESSEPAWSNVNLPVLVRAACRCPVFFDYDVNAGALAEAFAGAGRGAGSFFYLSVGTGVGGVVFRQRLTPGYAPQVGHMYLPREEDDRLFRGTCRFHGGCLQGLASGRAIAARWGQPAESLGADHPAWDLEARYLARACANLVYCFSPERIVLGSSVGCAPGLSAQVDTGLKVQLQGFVEPHLRALYASGACVVAAALPGGSSLVGAALLAREQAGLPML